LIFCEKAYVNLKKKLKIILHWIEKEFRAAKADMLLLVDKSFLSDAGKLKYKKVVGLHYSQLFNT